MSHDNTRKHFFGKLVGLAAAAAVAPMLLARPAPPAISAPVPRVTVRAERRAVARTS